MEIEIKIGRELVTFTDKDIFLDNGACVQCKTKQGKHMGYGRYTNLLLTKKALKELESKCERFNVRTSPSGVEYFQYKEK